MGRRAEAVTLGVALLLVAAFLASFALGLLGGEAPPAEEETLLEDPAALPTVSDPIGRIEVLNAAGRPGLARLATERLRNAGFDVVFFGNASPSAPDSSVVIDRVGRLQVARAAAEALGIRAVVSEPDSSLYLDATVILGPDWDGDPARR